MFHVSRRSATLPLLSLLVAALAFAAAQARAQNGPDKDKEEPPFHEYKGVRIGMTAEEARKKLGNPTDKDDKQEVYSVNDNETCQVYYDDAKKVFAVSITYLGGKAIPAAKNILGAEAEAKQDGSLYKL
ncbi:MAG: hypothetical protein DMF66_06955, partial [Acidobacteria bacterium]